MDALTFIPLLGGFASSYFSGDNMKKDYTRDFPPSWVFGPVWTVLYLMMGYASNIVFRRTGKVPIIFWIQLALNLLWSPVYFKQKNIKLAKTIIYALIGAVLLTMYEFRKIDSFAANLLVPYLAWLVYASQLF